MRRPLVSLAAAVVPLVLLSGCGSVGTEMRPGAAAVVDEEVVSMSEVDDVADSLCAVLVSQAAQAAQPGAPAASYPLGVVRSAAQRGLALNIVADRIAEEQGLDVSDDLEAGIATVRNAYQGVDDPALVEEAMPGFTGDGHLDLVLAAWGREDLGPQASEEEVRARGYQLGAEWADEHGLDSNPLFDSLEIGEGGVAAARQDLSVPASEWARMAAAPASQAEVAEITRDLPANQRCDG